LLAIDIVAADSGFVKIFRSLLKICSSVDCSNIQ
jgi:hypothetical protein